MLKPEWRWNQTVPKGYSSVLVQNFIESVLLIRYPVLKKNGLLWTMCTPNFHPPHLYKNTPIYFGLYFWEITKQALRIVII